jgi:soluble lytic murein transglycosylase-like protein
MSVRRSLLNVALLALVGLSIAAGTAVASSQDDASRQDDEPPASPVGVSGRPVILAPAAAGSDSGYRALIEAEARRAGMPPEVAEAVLAVESGYNPAAIGGVGEIGLMQILPSTARMLGFAGTLSELAVPATNIHYGVTYLAGAWRLAGHDLCTATMKYRAGHGETRFSYRSVDYCLRVRGKLAARGYPVVGNVPVATFGEATASCRRGCLRLGGRGQVNLAALNGQLSQIVFRVNAVRPSVR